MNIKDDLLPSRLEIVLYGLLSVVIAFVGSIRIITDYLLRGTEFNFDTARAQADQGMDVILQTIDNFSLTPATAVFVFWSIVGIIAFSIGQAVINAYMEFKQDVDISTRFLHPKRFVNLQFWLDAVLLTAAHLSLFVMLLMWSALLGFVLVPLAAGAAQGVVLDTGPLSLGIFACALVLLSIGVLVEAILIKLLFRRKQLAL